ncbi:MAG: epoxyqueuosine reductase [Candidatus Aminicenantes bacterium]|nr:MAG: epoxyqueuosine reductase [Candidatus Aminicenantes bacterium]
MSAAKNTESIKALASEMEFSFFGVADIRDVRKEFHLDLDFVSRFDRAISLGKRLLDPVIEGIKDRPTLLYFHHYRQLNFFLDRGAFLLSSRIQDRGFQALPIPASQIIDWDKQRSQVSHKIVGRLAGLGWIGRNNLLVNPDLGSRHRLVTILTDMPLELDEVVDGDCGKCVACLKTCPAQAIKQNKEDFDHWACFDKLKEFRRQGVVGQHICGVCVKACKGPK